MNYRFDHAAQVVPNIADAIGWYRENMPSADVRVLYEDATWGLITVGGTRLAFVTRDEHPNHLAWSVPSETLDALAAKHGKTVKPHRDGTRSFYLDAPGGNAVEIIAIEGSRYAELIGEKS